MVDVDLGAVNRPFSTMFLKGISPTRRRVANADVWNVSPVVRMATAGACTRRRRASGADGATDNGRRYGRTAKPCRASSDRADVAAEPVHRDDVMSTAKEI